MFNDRKSGYKLPPTTIRDKLVSQETRRTKALEEQKRRRAQRVDSTRQLDRFANLNLGGSDDDDDEIPEEESATGGIAVAPSSVAQYAGLLDRSSDTMEEHENTANPVAPSEAAIAPLIPATHHSSKKKPVKKRKTKRRTNKPSKWADQCMYAELLEMLSEDQLWSSNGIESEDECDGLPKDLESGWVAVAPVPVGKRCLAVTHQSAGVVGIAPNTTLRSRLLGKTLIQRFPSSLPPLTVLDCILDENWRDNGILHVLDVVKWKGQDVGDCEAGFRFWWRDTRLAELTQTHPPSTASHPHFVPIVGSPDAPNAGERSFKYRFPYPTSFVPIPFHSDTSLLSFENSIIPAAKGIRAVDVVVPVAPALIENHVPDEGGMEVEVEGADNNSLPGGRPTIALPMQHPPHAPFTFLPTTQGPPQMAHQTVNIQSDGLLLYVSEATYEPGTSPLSSWVPVISYEDQDHPDEHHETANDKGKQKEAGIHPQLTRTRQVQAENGPLALFHQLVRKRLARRPPHVLGQSTSSGFSNDVEMDV